VRRLSVLGRPLRLPAFIAEVVEDPRARRALIAGSAALFAAGLDPRVWSASLGSVQSAIRIEPELEAIILLAAVVESGLLLVGGAIGDSTRARPVIVGGLIVELATVVLGLVVWDGPVFAAARIVGMAASSFVIPVALALVATAYVGTARATAIGLAYAAYGAATALAPVLLEIQPTVQWPAFVVCSLACIAALALGRGRIRDLERPRGAERSYVVAVAWWGLGIVLLTTGILWFGSGWDNPLRWALLVAGGLALAIATAYERRRRRRSAVPVRIDRRPIAVAVFAGLVLALAQTVPMVELPLFFELVLRYSPLACILALSPLFAALILAGPIAGYLLAHASPRSLVGAGVIAVGVGDLLLAALVGPQVGYLGFVVPCLLVGAGFVIATTVRTAIIFASVPRGLPATAAALNEASLAVGARIGIVLTSAIVARAAVASYVAALSALPAQLVAQAETQFRQLITVTQSLPFAEVASAAHPGDIRPYLDAYDGGVRLALLFGAAVAIGAGVVAWLALGRHDPLTTVWEHQDERSPASAAASSAPAAASTER
jgi:MFS family permease